MTAGTEITRRRARWERRLARLASFLTRTPGGRSHNNTGEPPGQPDETGQRDQTDQTDQTDHPEEYQ